MKAETLKKKQEALVKFWTFHKTREGLEQIDRPREVEDIEEFNKETNFNKDWDIFVVKSIDNPLNKRKRIKKGRKIFMNPHKGSALSYTR